MAQVPSVSPKKVPSRWWYAVAVLTLIAGLGAMGLFLFSRLTTLGEGMTQIVVPGERSLALTPASYTIFHERVSVVDGKVYNSGGIGGLLVSVTGPDGATVPLSTASITSRYQFGGREGVSVFDFTIATAGDYVVKGAYDEGQSGPQTVIAVGAGFATSLFVTIIGGLAFAFTGAGLTIAIALIVFLRRRRAGFAV